MRKTPANPNDPVFDWDAETPHDKSPDALMFLLAADEAADTPERRQMLDGLLEGSDRDVQRVLESGADHGEVLDDDFFWCYMGLAMCQGDRNFWRVVSDWGYSLDSVAKIPDSKPGDKGMSLACWGASFVDPERLDWLERIGELNPWTSTHAVGQWDRLSAGEIGMIKGSPAHFDYWLPKWTAHIQERRRDSNRRNRVDVSCNIPTSISVLVGMMEWTKLPSSAEQSAPQYPDLQEMQRRLDAMLKAMTDTFYAKAPPGQMLATLTDNPPATGREKVFSVLAQWAIDRDENPFEKPLERQALKQQNFLWLRALVEHGAPLQRTSETVSLGQALVRTYLASKNSDDPKLLLQTFHLFTERAKREAPELLSSLWNHKFSNSTQTSDAYPEIVAVHSRQWEKAHKLLELGCPLAREGEPTQLGSVLLAKAARSEVNDDNKKHSAHSVFLQWMALCQDCEEGEEILSALWHTPVPLKSGGNTWPEHVVLDAGKNEALLAKIIQQGCPLGRRDIKGSELGFRLLRRAMTADDTVGWEAFRLRALVEGGTSIPEDYLRQSGSTLQANFASNPEQMKTAINAVELDVRWAGDVPPAAPRLRF